MKTSRRDFIKHGTFITFAVSAGGSWFLQNVAFGAEAADVSNYKVVSGEAINANGWLAATTKTEVNAPLTADAIVITVAGKTGKGSGGISISFLDSEGKRAKDIDGKTFPPFTIVASDLKLYKGDTYEDVYLKMSHPMRYFVRPNMFFYDSDRRKKLAANWDNLPAASDHEFVLEFRRVGGMLQTWIDGNLIDENVAPPQISNLGITLSPGAALRVLLQDAAAVSQTPLALPVAGHAWPQRMVDVQVSLSPNAALPAGFSEAVNINKGIAVGGLSLIPGLVNSDLQSYFWRRNAADNLLEQGMFSVPMDTYSHAYILCAADDAAGKINAFNLRVTRYGRSRGNAMADTTVHVPADNAIDDANVKRVGIVKYGSQNTRKNAPLWMIKVPLKNGLIQDLQYDDQKKSNDVGTYKYLDVELFDPLHKEEVANAFPPPMEPVRRGWKPVDPAYKGYDFYTAVPAPMPSGVTVLAMSLEKSPASMQVVASTGFQTFYAWDKPRFDAKITTHHAGSYTLKWIFADVDGTIADSGVKVLIGDRSAQQTIAIPIALRKNGWYAASFKLSDSAGNELIDYRTSFVMLPPDTRKAGLESPFYGWWFGSNHGDKITLDEIGPLLQRAGIRRADGSGNTDEMTENLTLPKYGFTHSTIQWTPRDSGRYGMKEFMAGTKTLEQAIAMQENYIATQLKSWPSIDRMLVFHESGDAGAPFPTELWGETAKPLDVKSEVTWKKRIEYLTAMAQMVRAKFPQIKMQYGNNGNSMNLIGELMRRKFPREYIDTFASEDLGQDIAPQRDQLYSTQDGWYLRELALKMGYVDVPITACTEWIGRMTEKLGLRKQAEWKAIDGIMALAYGYDTISIAGINDAGDGYYYSIYANGGLCERYPQMSPKPAYAAIATLTQVMDQVKFQRFVATGSTVLYCAEFKRADEWVYAIWTPRGERDVTLQFADNSKRQMFDFVGRESTYEGNLRAGTAVRYIVSPSKLISAAAGISTFTEDKANVPAKPMQVISLESLEVIDIESDKSDEKKTATKDLGKEIEGDFEIREVTDPEMGKCIEVELKPSGQLRVGEVEYVYLALKQNVTTTAKNAGLWIRGNGSWGNVDIKKNHWGPWADNGNLHRRWPGDASMNFDGWNFITYPYYDWVHTEGAYATTVVSGLRIIFPRNTLVGTERLPVLNQKIRIKSIMLF